MFKKPIIKTPQQIGLIREAGKWHNELLHLLMDAAKPGVILMELEAQAEHFLKSNNLTGGFKGYQGFPANCCLSVNDCVVHGIPDSTILKEGDLLKIDVGVTHQGCISDAAVSVIVGGDQENPQGAALIQATRDALDKGITTISPGGNFYQFGQTVAKTIEKKGFQVIKNLTGHGVGVEVHEAPTIYNRPHKSLKKTIAIPGMVVALEPITAIKSKEFVHGSANDRNIYTEHGDLGAQREYTIAINNENIEILAGILPSVSPI